MLTPKFPKVEFELMAWRRRRQLQDQLVRSVNSRRLQRRANETFSQQRFSEAAQFRERLACFSLGHQSCYFKTVDWCAVIAK